MSMFHWPNWLIGHYHMHRLIYENEGKKFCEHVWFYASALTIIRL